ncbi:helix-turn-helix domain-containing protein [Coprococcus sp. AF21-14LB]|uniref:helix-turn-helix domain-containing protein n=1 Tax=Coprococcus sp. AF21-14LB TaxID=2292231 RepID=UPI000E50A252|nr:helix-turn-helix domain-containing protein [Coprococcus sp. AF21-14LB]QUO31454.1 helix-turn-helix domain-containing protein [Faecalicatena sp. Marseille-Q4148]RGS77921.1 helix-turn-helix domain-containing protein [Coprococcus sp. AF21-14LB]
MNKRIKEIRQNAGMTQREFADRIGVSRNTIAAYETDARVPIDAIIVSICREFNVNEDWLRTGLGNMYAEVNPDIQLSKALGSLLREEAGSFKKQLILSLLELNQKEWDTLEKLITSVTKKYNL